MLKPISISLSPNTEKDDVVSFKKGQFINQNIKNSKLLIIPGANHDLERKAPEILVQKILNSINL